jgi:MFS family permease
MVGMSLGFGIGYIFEEQGNSGWVLLFRFAYIMALVMSILSTLLPHNPTWLVYHGHSPEAILDSLQFIHPNATEATVAVLIQKIEADKAAMEKITRDIEHKYTLIESDNCHWLKTIGLYPLLTDQMRMIADDRLLSRCVEVKIVLNTLKILTGQTAILYFGSSIYTELYPNHVQEIILGYILTRAVVALGMIFIGDLAGRRVYLLLSALIMCLLLLLADVGLFLACIDRLI